MATKNATYKLYNGTDWDIYYFKTSAGQVGETTNLKFLHLDTHKVNNKAFTATSGITLYGTDIKYSNVSEQTVSQAIDAAQSIAEDLESGLTDGTITVYKAERDGSGNIISSTYAKQTDLTALNVTVEGHYSAITNLSNLFTTGAANKAVGDKDGNDITTTYVKKTLIGEKNGVASLDSNGKVPSSQLPSYVDDVLEYASKSSFPTTGESGKIYVDQATNKTYRWGGSAYVEISASLAIGTTTGTAYDGASGHALNSAVSSLGSTVSNLSDTVTGMGTNISSIAGYFTNGIANKATGDKNGKDISTTYLNLEEGGTVKKTLTVGSGTGVVGLKVSTGPIVGTCLKTQYICSTFKDSSENSTAPKTIPGLYTDTTTGKFHYLQNLMAENTSASTELATLADTTRIHTTEPSSPRTGDVWLEITA